MVLLAGRFRWFVPVAALVAALAFPAVHAGAQKVDGIKGKEATAPVNLQVTPTNAFVRIRGWSLPAPLLPLSVMGSWGGRGMISGAGAINVPVGEISRPSAFEFPRDINGETETMIVSLYARSDWTGSINPMSGEVQMNMPMTLRIEAHHVRMVDIPWPGGWIYGNIDCTVGLDFAPMTTGHMEPPFAGLEVPPVTDGVPYKPADGTFTVINNSMSIGGFHCTHPDIGAGKVEDELNGAVAIPSAPGTTDSRFNLSFLEGGDVVRPQPAIRPAFGSTPDGPGVARLDGSGSHAAAGVLRYVWDFNSDGKPDQTVSDPVVRHDFEAPGQHEVGLIVIDKDRDMSGWKKAEVTTTSKPKAVRRLAVSARGPKRARPGAKVKLRVKVANPTGRQVKKVVACVSSRCKKLGAIPAGNSKTLNLKRKLKRPASGTVTLVVRASGKGVKPGTARVRIKVK
jgi:hypothetical protein